MCAEILRQHMLTPKTSVPLCVHPHRHTCEEDSCAAVSKTTNKLSSGHFLEPTAQLRLTCESTQPEIVEFGIWKTKASFEHAGVSFLVQVTSCSSERSILVHV